LQKVTQNNVLKGLIVLDVGSKENLSKKLFVIISEISQKKLIVEVNLKNKKIIWHSIVEPEKLLYMVVQ
jgi:hypothetical protein